jgi:hypothetical protein
MKRHRFSLSFSFPFAFAFAFALGFAFVFATPAHAEETTEGTIALLDLRPILSGTRYETGLDLLPEAVAVSKRLRVSLAQATSRRVLTPLELRAELGPNSRVFAFNCREHPACLRPLFLRLQRLGVERVYFGTLRQGRTTDVVELQTINLSNFSQEKNTLLSIPIGQTIEAEELAQRLPAEARAPAEPRPEGRLPKRPRPPERTPPERTPEPRPGEVAEAAQTLPTEDDGGDLVETIGGDDLRSPKAPTQPLPPDRFQLNGWVRTSVEVGFSSGTYNMAPDPTAVPYDQLVIRAPVLMRARYSHARWFEAALSGALIFNLYEQNPASPADTFNLFNGQRVVGQVEPSLREVYFGFYTKRFDLRLGQQRVAWGRTDTHSPNDVLNARDLRNPILDEQEIFHIPTPMVRGDIDLSFAVLELVFQPFFTPDRFNIYGGNWGIIQPDAPAPLRGFFRLATSVPTLQLIPDLAQTGLPRLTFEDPSAGARLSFTGHKIDASFYYHYGFDSTPYISFDPAFAQALGMLNFANTHFADLTPLLALVDAGHQLVSVQYLRRHHVGFDLAAPVGPLVLRLDAAYDSGRVFYRRDLAGFSSGVIDAVAAIEYQSGEVDKVVLVEGTYLHLIDQPTAPLLFVAQDTFGVAAVLRWIFFKRLLIEGRGNVGIQPFSYALRPEIGVKLNALSLRVGAEILGGDPYSFGSWFRRNTSVYVLAKYNF